MIEIYIAGYLIEISILILVLFYYKLTKKPPPNKISQIIEMVSKIMEMSKLKRRVLTNAF